MVATVPSLVERALPVLRRYGALRAGLFGSYARGEPMRRAISIFSSNSPKVRRCWT